RTALASYAAMQAAWTVAQHGNESSITDAAVGAQTGFTGVRGGGWNVLINLKDITDPVFVRETRGQCETLLREAQALLDRVTAHVDKRLGELIEGNRRGA
ncbi:MAG TPA: cyclodeaminase/cyclohydrolase family protein, partial [Candidatus Methylomirabilis sp.]